MLLNPPPSHPLQDECLWLPKKNPGTQNTELKPTGFCLVPIQYALSWKYALITSIISMPLILMLFTFKMRALQRPCCLQARHREPFFGLAQ